MLTSSLSVGFTFEILLCLVTDQVMKDEGSSSLSSAIAKLLKCQLSS